MNKERVTPSDGSKVVLAVLTITLANCNASRTDLRNAAETTTVDGGSAQVLTQDLIDSGWAAASSQTQLTPDQGWGVEQWLELWQSSSMISSQSRQLVSQSAMEVRNKGISYANLDDRCAELSLYGTPQWDQFENETAALFGTLPLSSGASSASAPSAAAAAIRGRCSARGGGFLLWLPGVLLCTNDYHDQRDYAQSQCSTFGFRWDASCAESYDRLNAAACGGSCGVTYAYNCESYISCCLGTPAGGWQLVC